MIPTLPIQLCKGRLSEDTSWHGKCRQVQPVPLSFFFFSFYHRCLLSTFIVFSVSMVTTGLYTLPYWCCLYTLPCWPGDSWSWFCSLFPRSDDCWSCHTASLSGLVTAGSSSARAFSCSWRDKVEPLVHMLTVWINIGRLEGIGSVLNWELQEL